MRVKAVVALLSGLLLSASAGAEETRAMPVNPKATKEARQLLAFLHSIQGRHTLSGQHNFIASGSLFTEKVRELTGKTPLVWGSDFSFAYQGEAPRDFQHCGPLNLTTPGTEVGFTSLTPEAARESLVKNAIEAHRRGHVVTLMWHACPPSAGGDACDGRAIWTWDRRPSAEEWDRLTTDGTPQNESWKRQVDVIAGHLKRLQDKGVPVLWRPYHEMNGIWFWWCDKKGPDGFRKLWRMMYDRYVLHHRLDNLLWVWNTNAPRLKPGDEAWAYEGFFPGLDVVDVLAADVYHDDWKPSHHDDLARLAQGKPIAIGEVGSPPIPETLAAQPRWAWFMPWGDLAFWGKGPERLKALLAEERILSLEEVTRGEDGAWRIGPKEAARQSPATATGAAAARRRRALSPVRCSSNKRRYAREPAAVTDEGRGLSIRPLGRPSRARGPVRAAASIAGGPLELSPANEPAVKQLREKNPSLDGTSRSRHSSMIGEAVLRPEVTLAPLPPRGGRR